MKYIVPALHKSFLPHQTEYGSKRNRRHRALFPRQASQLFQVVTRSFFLIVQHLFHLLYSTHCLIYIYHQKDNFHEKPPQNKLDGTWFASSTDGHVHTVSAIQVIHIYTMTYISDIFRTQVLNSKTIGRFLSNLRKDKLTMMKYVVDVLLNYVISLVCVGRISQNIPTNMSVKYRQPQH